MLAMVMGAKESVGAMLPMLIVGDVFAVLYWHRKADWGIIRRILLPAATGIVAGWFVLGWISDPVLKRAIGGIVVGLITLQVLRDYGIFADERVPHHWSFAWVMGVMAGVVTMLANAAGPIIIIFLLAMKLDRFRFIGTIAWYFFILNAFKVPFFVNQGMISGNSLLFNLEIAPVVLAGCWAGIYAPRFIPEKPFRWLIIILAAVAGVKLLVWG